MRTARGVSARWARPLAWAVCVLALTCAPAAAQGEPNCSAAGKNLYVRDVLTRYYLWYPFLPALDPVRYDSPEAYLEAVRYRPIDHAYSYVTSREANEAFYSESQFIGFGFSTRVDGTTLRVLQVFEGSPAEQAGLGRGQQIISIDGRSVRALIESNQIGTAFGPAEVGLEVEVAFETRDGVMTQARMTKRAVTIPTVSLSRVFDVDGRRVGYVFFRNFVRPSTAALDNAFAALKAAGVTELVLDLRYNGGGLVDVAVHLGSLIGGAPTNGRVMATYAHNDKQRARDEVLRFASVDHALGLSRLVVVTTAASASASELVINALRPYMPVVVVGQRTYGKPVGQYGFPFCDKVLAPVYFSIRNALDEGDYYDGIPADCAAADDITHDLGDAAEGSLGEALQVIRTGACTAAPGTGTLPQRAPSPSRALGWQSIVNAW